jgi:hypothetical protein
MTCRWRKPTVQTACASDSPGRGDRTLVPVFLPPLPGLSAPRLQSLVAIATVIPSIAPIGAEHAKLARTGQLLRNKNNSIQNHVNTEFLTAQPDPGFTEKCDDRNKDQHRSDPKRLPRCCRIVTSQTTPHRSEYWGNRGHTHSTLIRP